MATTHITAVKQTLIKSIDYIVNSEKTENGQWVQALNCPTESRACFEAMMQTKRDFQNMKGVQGHVIRLSFKPNELNETKAMEIATEFSKRYLGKDYEVLIGLHNDKKHIHAHILFNSVSFHNGLKYHSNIGSYYQGIRRLSDELCKEYGLSVPIPKQKKAQHYYEWKAEQEGFKTWKDLARQDVNIAIAKSIHFPDFLIQLENMGYCVNNDPSRKHITIQPFGSEKRIRLNNLGTNYDEQAIKNRIANHINHFVPERKTRNKISVFHYSRQKPHMKMTRFQAIYLKYKYRLQKISMATRVPKRQLPLKEDLKNYQLHLNAYRFIQTYKIDSLQSVKALQNESYTKLNAVKQKIKHVKSTEKEYKTDFQLLSEYNRLKVGAKIMEQGKANFPNLRDEYNALCFVLAKRGYDNDSKIQALSHKKTESIQTKETLKEEQNQIRQILRHCKNVLHSYEKIQQVSTDTKALSKPEKQKEKQNLHRKDSR